MLWPKKNSYKEFDNKKNSCGSKIPLPRPAITFLMVRPLPGFSTLGSTGPIEKLKEGQEGEKLVRLLDTVTRMFNSQVRVRVNPSPFLR